MTDSLLVTTAPNPSEMFVQTAVRLADELKAPFVPRKGTVRRMAQTQGVSLVLVVSHRLTLHIGDQELFFHPSMANVRVKRMLAGETDYLIEKSGLQPGDTVIDCTLGMGADAIVFSHAAGENGRVIGLEKSKILAILVREGLHDWIPDFPEMKEAMQRIEVVQTDHLSFLRKMPDRSADVVYFDPMFRSTVEKSTAFDTVRMLSDAAPLSIETIQEAKRVASKSVVLKERAGGGEFLRLGFPAATRRSSTFTYSVIRIEEEES
ncbi:class I SAM-dependent methyltransferase [Effusibacillus dendaii]|uniref:SAM-dependent methyltransferase n=1 Tax=Effusibacillus dendaii TaxID=2743772 RepID=A0A7I8D6U7_9BACL|nr:class I SAM-dependent methyltransferase [Effusibacillus dendaii]BCJ85727.1 hypothetical protein skT53_07120 [Effusibacillus dendaii]